MTQDPKLELDAKWDKLIDLGLRRLAYGLTLGAATGLLLFKGCATRTAAAAFGAGCGVGSAFQQVSKEFEDLVPSLSSQK